MKGWLAAFVLMTAMSTSVVAQDSTIASQSQETHSSTMAQPSDAPMAQPANTGSMPASASVPASAHKGYGSEDYGGRAEIFLSGFGLFSSQANGNAITEQQTNAGGLALGYRYHLISSSALEARYGFSRNSEKYTIRGAISSIPSYFSEISGSYVYTFSKSQHIRPFLEAGGGAVIFIPGNYNTPSSAAVAGTSTCTSNGLLSGYAISTLNAYAVASPAYTGSSAGIGTQSRGMFLYGGGLEIPVSSHFYLRTEFRALGYEAPDFKLSLQTSALSFTYEPAFAVAYRF
jgi:hypothetical protein